MREVEGKDRPLDPQGGLADIAPTFTEEVVNLHLLATGSSDRQAALEQYLVEP